MIEVDGMTDGTDNYTKSVISAMYSDPATRILDGGSVDNDGNLGWFSYVNGEKLIAGFKRFKNKYAGKAGKFFDYSRELFSAVIYKHESAEEEDYAMTGGRTPHPVMEVKNLKSTPKGTDIEMAEMAVTELGLEHGTEQATDVARISNIIDVIRDYKDNLTENALERYDMFMDNVAELVSIPKPAYAYAKEGD